jgi:hypothetical protein
MLTSAVAQKMMNIICHYAGPLILQTFCSAKDETISVGDNLTCKLNPNFGVDEGKAMRKLTVEKSCEEARKLGRIRRQVLQGLVACLHYSGNSFQVILLPGVAFYLCSKVQQQLFSVELHHSTLHLGIIYFV